MWNLGHEAETLVWGGDKSFPYDDGMSVPILTIPNPLANPQASAAYIDSYTEANGFDAIIALWDGWALNFLHYMIMGVPTVAYWPVDGVLTRRWAEFTRPARVQAAMSWFGYKEMLNYYPLSRVRYIPHAVDTETFSPLGSTGKWELRDSLTENSQIPVPEEAFLFTVVGANFGDRKNLPNILDTFKKFHDTHADSFLYLHTNAMPQKDRGYAVPSLIAERGLGKCVSYPKRNTMVYPATDKEMNILYNTSDVIISDSDAEGFGLPLMEAQAAGTPVIAPDSSAQTELVKDHGWLFPCVPEEAYAYYPDYLPTNQRWKVPDQRGLLRAMEDAYSDPSATAERGASAHRFAQAYSWDNVMPRWENLLDEISDENLLKEDLVRTIRRIQESM